jgi:hypothetical protein
MRRVPEFCPNPAQIRAPRLLFPQDYTIRAELWPDIDALAQTVPESNPTCPNGTRMGPIIPPNSVLSGITP